MNNDFLKQGIGLCLAVYRITDKFPENEILRHRLRAVCIDINEFLSYNKPTPANLGRPFDLQDLENKFKLLEGYLIVAEKQGWVRGENFQILRGEYKRLRYELAEYWGKLLSDSDNSEKKNPTRKRDKAKYGKKPDLSERQEGIVKVLGGRSEGLIMEDLAKEFEVSKKTIERELKILLKKRLVLKEGQTRSARFILA